MIFFQLFLNLDLSITKPYWEQFEAEVFNKEQVLYCT